MPNINEPARGIIIPFPIEAIRRHPTPAFVTQPATSPRARAHDRFLLLWLAPALLLAGLFAGLALAGMARRGARRDDEHAELVAPAHARTGPRAGVPGSVNLLIAGLEGDISAAGTAGTAAAHGVKSDALMLLHLDADRERAWLVSIPRDTWVSIPGHGHDTIDAAYAVGGPAALVATLQQLTRLQIDHVAVIDPTGFGRLTDLVGGVALSLDPPGPPVDAQRGGLALELSGAMALDYVRTLAPGDADHIRREHRFLRALLSQLHERGTLIDPRATRDLAAALGTSVRVDAWLTPAAIRSLLESTNRLEPSDVTFLTAPLARAGLPGEATDLHTDGAGSDLLWDALAHDEMPAFVDAYPDLVSPVTGH